MSKWAEEFIEKYNDSIDKLEEWNKTIEAFKNLNQGGINK